MPQFDKYLIGTLIIATVIVFGFLYLLFKRELQAFFKMAIDFRDRILKEINSRKKETQLGVDYSTVSFHNDYFDFKEEASKTSKEDRIKRNQIGHSYLKSIRSTNKDA